MDGITYIDDEAALRAVLREPAPPAVRKQLPALDEHAKAWIAESPFCLIATADAEGRCDVSPKGDPAGFATVLDDHTIAIPERPGNRRADGYRNVLANPHAGLIFLIPGADETLRVNGRARVASDAPFFDRMAVRGRRPVLALVVEVEEVYFHCAKAFKRSALWRPGTWPDRAGLPTLGRIMKDQLHLDDDVAALDRSLEDSYQKNLY